MFKKINEFLIKKFTQNEKNFNDLQNDEINFVIFLCLVLTVIILTVSSLLVVLYPNEKGLYHALTIESCFFLDLKIFLSTLCVLFSGILTINFINEIDILNYFNKNDFFIKEYYILAFCFSVIILIGLLFLDFNNTMLSLLLPFFYFALKNQTLYNLTTEVF